MTLVASNRRYLKPGSFKPGLCQSTTPELKHAPVQTCLCHWTSGYLTGLNFSVSFFERKYGLGRECDSVGRVLA